MSPEEIERALAPFRELNEGIANLLRAHPYTAFGRILAVDEDSDGMILTVQHADLQRDWVITISAASQ